MRLGVRARRVAKALLVEGNCGVGPLVRSVLADAGCVDIEAMSMEDALTRDGDAAFAVAVVHVADGELARLHRLALGRPGLPIVAICDEQHIDAVLVAGAKECVTEPVRARELLGRLRCAMREREEAAQQAHRERRLSDTIVALKKEKHELERLVCVDALTGVANRRHTMALLDSEWRRSGREHRPLGLVMVDLDCYHQYNEQYGHLGGDACLQRVAEAMVKCLRRPADFLGRYGGEEFLAVLPNTDAVGAKIVAERLRAAVESLAIPHCASVCSQVVTITAGFASLHVAPDLTVDRLIAVADGALLRAKSRGRNRIEGDAPLVRPSRVSAQKWQRFEPVFVDPWFADRIPAFLVEAHAGARTVVQALRNGEMWRVNATTAALEGSARELGLPVVEQCVRVLTACAESADLNATANAADDLIDYIAHVQVVYRRVSEPAKPLITVASAS